MASLIGRTLGNYKIIDNLGQGGMATVYVGYQEAVDRRVAIKVLPPHPGMSSGFEERFDLEAKTIAKLQHPHILPLFDYGQQEDVLYLVTPYVDGGSLDDRMRKGRLSLREVEKVLREVAGALDYAHRRGVIHRDIKPANILMSSEGHTLLADFGIAKLMEGNLDLTGTGVVGTPSYIAPEAAQGLTIDGRADIYALGVVVYQMLTGEYPISAPSVMQLMLRIIQDPPRHLLEVAPQYSEELGLVLDRVLLKDPNDRYQTATEFAEAFTVAIHDGDELAAVRSALPLGEVTPIKTTFNAEEISDPDKTLAGKPESRNTISYNQTRTPEGAPPTTQTVVIRQGVSPNVLLIVAGIMAAAIIVAVVVVLATRPDGPPGDESGPTQSSNIGGPPNNSTLPNFGRLTFTTVNNPDDTDTLDTDGLDIGLIGIIATLRVDGLDAAPNGQTYVAWLRNTVDDSVLKLGALTLDAFGNGALNYTDADERVLPAEFNSLLITLEEDADTETPGEAVYGDTIPFELTDFMGQMFVGSDVDGGDGDSLLVLLGDEAKVVIQHSGYAAQATNIAGMHTHAEHTLNVLNGAEEDYNGNGRGENPGRGVGVFPILDLLDSTMQEALVNAPFGVQGEAELMRVCLQNTRLRAERIASFEQQLLAEAEDIAKVATQAEESTRVAGQLIAGFDLNDNGTIEAFEGECGLEQIQTFGLLVASMNVHEIGE